MNGYLARSTEKSETGDEGKFLQNLASAVDLETGTRLTQAELVENAIVFLTAGSGTTAATMIYLIWECGRNSAVRKRLIDEIRTAFPDPKVANVRRSIEIGESSQGDSGMRLTSAYRPIPAVSLTRSFGSGGH